MAEENKINLNLDFESIVPWNGQQDTGRDVRLKLDRNWKKVVNAFNTLLNGEFLDDKYLRKDKDDRSVGTIASDKGFEIGKFQQGELGSGGILKMDEEGNSYLEVDKALFRKIAYFVEVMIKKLSHIGGTHILTPASMKCSKVEEFTDYYRCYFENEHEGRTINQEFVVGDQARSQTFNIKEGLSQNVSNQYYWRLVVGTGANYIDLSKTDCDSGSGVPLTGDEIVLCGNRDNPSRQNALILSSYGEGTPSLIMYKGIKSYSLADAKTTTKLSPEENELTGIVNIEAGSTGASNLEDFPEEVFKAVHIGAVNLLRNSGFTGDYKSEELSASSSLNSGSELYSKGLKYWTGSASVSDDANAVSGKCAVVGSLSQAVELIKGESYVVSFKGKGTSVSVYLGGMTEIVSLTSEYAKKSVKFISDGIGTFSISGDATICDLQLERGTIATDWKPSPYDNDKTLAEFQALKYLRDAIVEGDTTILGGLILSSIIKLGNYKDGKMQKVNAGVSGIYNDDNDVAFWGGGTFEEAIKTVMKFKENPNYQPTPEEWANLANFVVTHGGDLFLRCTIFAENGYFRGRLEQGNGATILERDGSGHLANGAISWNPYGVMYRRAYDVIVWRKITDSPSVIDLNLGTYLDLTGDASTYTLPNATFDGTPLYLRWEQISRSSYCAILQGSFKAKVKSDGEITYQSANKLTLYVEDKDIQLKYSTEESAWIYEGAGVIINENGLMIIDRVVESETEIMADKVTSNSFAVGDRLGITQTISVYENGGRSYFTFTGGILTAYKYESNEE